jgi:AraC-like DNA-binding protein/mannose-6-phosphate isomerase-like protein (cupin superfamily)
MMEKGRKRMDTKPAGGGPRSRPAVGSGKAFAALLAVCDRLKFEPHRIASQLDAHGHYEIELDREFPFHVRLFHFRAHEFTPDRTWHERLELFLPLDGPARLRMGEHRVELSPGDILVVDNLKLHNVEDFPELDTRVVVVSFLPEFVYSLGSPSHDYAFLLPFYSQREGAAHVLRRDEALASPVYDALVRVLECYFERGQRAYYQAGCKAGFLSMLYPLACRFQASHMLRVEFVRQQELARRLSRLFDHLRLNYAERTTVREAARLVNMSDSQFMKAFKRVAGMSFVAYLTHLRVSNARRLLENLERSVAEIAMEVGFADQSYFDRRFRQAFGMSPRQFRRGLAGRGGAEELSEKNIEAS